MAELPRPAAHRDNHQTARLWLVAGVAVIAFVNAIPLAIQAMWAEPTWGQGPWERWAYGVMLISALQLVYAFFLYQVPDRSAVWVVSGMMLLVTSGYAMLLGIRLLAPDQNQLLTWLDLEGNHFSSGQEAGWCLIMVLSTGVLSYLAGRTSARWRS